VRLPANELQADSARACQTKKIDRLPNSAQECSLCGTPRKGGPAPTTYTHVESFLKTRLMRDTSTAGGGGSRIKCVFGACAEHVPD